MEQALDIIRQILVVLFWILEGNVLYYVFLHIIGLLFHRQKYPIVEDKIKYCVFVPCHNEGPVVAATVENYTHIEYNKDLFDIYFIADNCSDNTVEILEKTIKEYNQSNFHVLVRNEPDMKKRGKPHALKWAIDTLEQDDHFYNYYDMMIIFDADNFVDAGILRHFNSQYQSIKPKKKPVMIQCYLDSKNKKGLIAKGYFETYRVMNAFWQMSKQKLHLVPGIGGTGFTIDTKFLKEIGGFNCRSLTEDLEIETIATIKNKRIEYNRNVRIYDEKPTRLKQAFVQKTRWAQGHWYLSFKYIPILFIQLFNIFTIKNFFKKIDNIIYLASRLFGLFTAISVTLNAFCVISCWTLGIDPNYTELWVQIVNLSIAALSIIIIPIASLFDGTKEEKRRIFLDFIPNVISIYFISAVDIITGILGLLKCWNQKVWKKTAHSITTMDSSISGEATHEETKETESIAG